MSRKKREMRLAGYERYFLMVDISGLLFATWAVGWAVRGAEDWVTVLGAVWLISLLVLFSRKRRDEFAEYCWRRATSATFGMLLIAPLVVTFVSGVAEGFMAEHARDAGLARDNVRPEDFEPPLGAMLILIFGTFFLSFEWTRFRGGPA